MMQRNSITCGLALPKIIGNGYTEDHWSEVKKVVVDILEGIPEVELSVETVDSRVNFEVRHNRIVHNLYHNDLVICDVSGKDPNVMFELGMRLSFNKPVIILKDDTTLFAFDIEVIDHIPYPRTMGIVEMEEFSTTLRQAVSSVFDPARTSQSRTFVSSFLGSPLHLNEQDSPEFVQRTLMLLLENQRPDPTLAELVRKRAMALGSALGWPYSSTVLLDSGQTTIYFSDQMYYRPVKGILTFSRKDQLIWSLLEPEGLEEELGKHFYRQAFIGVLEDWNHIVDFVSTTAKLLYPDMVRDGYYGTHADPKQKVVGVPIPQSHPHQAGDERVSLFYLGESCRDVPFLTFPTELLDQLIGPSIVEAAGIFAGWLRKEFGEATIFEFNRSQDRPLTD
jgi:hypothetical protein